MNRTERGMVAEVERISSMLGLPEVRVARMLDSEAREAAQENARREAEAQRAREAGEDALWAHQHANLEAGLPADTSMTERLQLLNPMSDDVARDASAPYGSASNPAFMVTTPGGGLVDIGYQAQQAKAQAQRSFTETVDDALLARAREQAADSFMTIQVSQFRSRRRAAEAQRAAAAAGGYGAAHATQRERVLAAQRYTGTGTGWPEIAR